MFKQIIDSQPWNFVGVAVKIGSMKRSRCSVCGGDGFRSPYTTSNRGV